MWKSVRVLLVAALAAFSTSVQAGPPLDVKVDPTGDVQIEKGIGDGVAADRYARRQARPLRYTRPMHPLLS